MEKKIIIGILLIILSFLSAVAVSYNVFGIEIWWFLASAFTALGGFVLFIK